MKLRPISEEILNRSARNGIFFASFSLSLILIILFLYIYDIFFGRTEKLVKGYIPEITSALIMGDYLFAKKLLSSIEKSNYFSTLYISEGVSNKIVTLNGEKLSIINKLDSSSKYSFYILRFDVLFFTSTPLGSKSSLEKMYLVSVQKVNCFIIILFICVLFSIWCFMFLYMKNQSKKNYEKMFIPIKMLSENIKEISSCKEKYTKFVTYSELDLIYKNFNNVYIELAKAQEQLKQMEMMRVISTTIQMLAHDLRHPFAHIKNALHVMLRLSSYDEIRQYIKDTGRAIEKDILKVENMLSDLLHFRTEGRPNSINTSFYKLVYSVIKSCFEVQSKTEIQLKYNFNHKFLIHIDFQKMERVLSNIFSNAIEAMGGKGKIEITTREFKDNGILKFEICIANTNSHIDDNCKDKIFDLFFTKGKKRGTGLGLGIAKEIVQQHGGRIFYNSSISQGVKFYIHLPQPNTTAEDHIEDLYFPSEANYFETHFDSHYNSSQIEYEKKSNNIESKILNYLAHDHSSKKYKILILEDDEVYVKNFSSLISSEDLNNYFSIYSYSDYNLAMEAVYKIDPEYIICDIDLGLDHLNGFDFVKKLREDGNNAKICIHTNRFLKCDLERAIEVKSDFFIAKPMSRFQFLRFICSHLIPHDFEESIQDQIIERQRNLRTIVVIDDEDAYHQFWKVTVTDAHVMTFLHPDAALEFFYNNLELVQNIECIIVDFYFDNSGQNICETNFLEKLKDFNFTKPVFVSTNAILNKETARYFSGVIKKEPYSMKKLKETFSNQFDLQN
ncbi:hybrid sensor histidine kinase/response regulator [Silvanigrella aquatica]|uniref:histidine kinase n=1 Tax=Silvanigrella aquatica TaxID=1915309 RepID=A0A1L4CYF6_9BACT|nr:hybrid sensor histidine kinase/response regulator [Silvanigrella aquatica]APJ02970.1 hypothetical protein AXG55_03185 [Silvanigrella aquatica]